MCRTFPPWNIAWYNAIGGSGDELYGTEPVSYYIINLLLTMSVAWPLALLSIIVYAVDALRGVAFVQIGVCLFSLMTWLVVLFFRPHKVSKFYIVILFYAIAGGTLHVSCLLSDCSRGRICC